MNKVLDAPIIIILIALFFIPSANAQTIKKVNFETIDKGNYSYYKDNDRQDNIEIYNQQEWQIFWNQHIGGLSPKPLLPKVDFKDYFVIAAMDEIRASGGYTLEIEEVTIDTSVENHPFGIIIKLKQPGSAAGTTAALTRPYHIVKIKR
ncbi:MAG: protease complex subunit PrcB family protein [Candidatus Omnitrophota bacterium]|jgi:hypothetical protein